MTAFRYTAVGHYLHTHPFSQTAFGYWLRTTPEVTRTAIACVVIAAILIAAFLGVLAYGIYRNALNHLL